MYSSLPTEETREIIHRPYKRKQIWMCLVAVGISFTISMLPLDLSPSSLQTFAIFCGVIFALMTTKYPISLVTFVGLTTMVLFKTLLCQTKSHTTIECKKCNMVINDTLIDCDPFVDGFATALTGFSYPLVWMIFSAFHIGTALQKTRLGDRISLLLVMYMGQTVYGLGGALFLSELVLGPFIPSNTARGGGIILPIVVSLIQSIEESQPGFEDLSTGRFLVLVGTHSNLLVSSLFLTGAAPNPIIARLALHTLGIQLGFLDWFRAAVIPATISAILLLFFFSVSQKPTYQSDVVLEKAKERYHSLGGITVPKLQLIGVLMLALTLWMTTRITGLSEALVAFICLLLLLLLDVLEWSDVIRNEKAWDTFFWLSGMLLMADQLSHLGFSEYIGFKCQALVMGMTSSPYIGSMLLGICYFLTMYFFPSITGHAVALAGPFMSASAAFDSTRMVYLLAYYTSLSACLTPFSTGSVVLYFSQGYFQQKEWIVVGMVAGLVYLCVYSLASYFY